MPGIRGVVLDIDGTFIDSNDAHARSFVDAFDDFGHAVPFDKVRAMIGMGGDKLLEAAIAVKADSQEGQAIRQRKHELFTERLPRLKAFPGARALIERMQREGLRLAIASAAQEQELEGLLKQAGIDDLVPRRTSSSDVENSKPDPDVVKTALGKLGLPANEVLMLGDTPYDIEAAGRAGVGVIAVRCGGWDDAALAGAVAVYDGPADLLAHFDASPLAQGVIGRKA